MPDLIKELGAVAGLAACVGVAILSLLYFIQARDVRRLREWAGGAPERDAPVSEATSEVAAERADELKRLEEERRRAEQAREAERKAAAMREHRRQRREAGLPEDSLGDRIRGRFRGDGESRLPPARYLALIIGAVIVLGGGVAFAALQVLGDDNGGQAANGDGLSRPGETEVAVLNGTAVAGLADRTSDDLAAAGYLIGAVTNSNSSFDASLVMFKSGFKPEARKVASELRIQQVRPMSQEISTVAEGANLAVVVGQDKANEIQAN